MNHSHRIITGRHEEAGEWFKRIFFDNGRITKKKCLIMEQMIGVWCIMKLHM